MRLFAAIPVSEPVKALAARIIAEGTDRLWPVRWVEPDQMHLTVKFFGEVPNAQADAVAASLAAAVRRTGLIPIEAAGAGVFPLSGRPRVIWLGVEAPGALELLHHRVEVGAGELGFPGEGTPYRPHITVGRVRRRERLADDVRGLLEGIGERVAFLADRLLLIESRVTSAGATHHHCATFRLDGA